MGIIETGTPQVWDEKQFANHVLNVVKGHEISITQLPQSLQLSGQFLRICDELIAATMADPALKERAKLGIVSTDKKSLKILKEIFVGEKTFVAPQGVQLKIHSSLLGEQYNQDEHAALMIHTHGVADNPPSPTDLEKLIRTIEDDGVVAEWVLTPSIRFLLLRTLQTPLLSRSESRQEIALLNQELDQRRKAQIQEFAHFMKKYGGVPTHQQLAMDAKVQMTLLLDTVKKYHLGLYTSTKNGSYSRVTS